MRNYQARNFMRDDMRVGDRAFFYHSSCPEPGIAGIVEISKLAYPDATQFDPKSPYYDAKSTREAPRWLHVDVKLVKKTRLVTLPMLRATAGLDDDGRAAPRQPLSITPVTPAEWKIVEKLANPVSEMDWTLLPVLLAIGAVIGFLAGLLGIGGGMTLVPLLTLLFTTERFPAAHVVHMAVATSTATMVFTALVVGRAHQRKGAVLWAVVAAMAPGIVLGSLVGPQIASALPGARFAAVFGVFVWFSALRMLSSARRSPAASCPGNRHCLQWARVLARCRACSAPGADSSRSRISGATTCRSIARWQPRRHSACRSRSRPTLGFILAGLAAA